jgi:hypothetical protein
LALQSSIRHEKKSWRSRRSNRNWVEDQIYLRSGLIEQQATAGVRPQSIAVRLFFMLSSQVNRFGMVCKPIVQHDAAIWVAEFACEVPNINEFTSPNLNAKPAATAGSTSSGIEDISEKRSRSTVMTTEIKH